MSCHPTSAKRCGRSAASSARAALLAALLTLLPGSGAGGETLAGLALCQSCHGVDAQGNQALGAPALAGLPGWYLISQFTKFKQGQRGADAADEAGARMAQAVAPITPEAWQALQPAVLDWTARGRPSVAAGEREGRAFYDHRCGACHGPEGVGNESMQAPPLAGIQPWYMLAQLEKFSAGLRGAQAADTYGAQMRFILGKLDNRAEWPAIAAFLAGDVPTAGAAR